MAQYSHLEWISNEALQLQRFSHACLGIGPWLGATDTIPRTASAETWANLDIDDPRHPMLRYCSPSSDDSQINATSEHTPDDRDEKVSHKVLETNKVAAH